MFKEDTDESFLWWILPHDIALNALLTDEAKKEEKHDEETYYRSNDMC